jgi:hypothetical protein
VPSAGTWELRITISYGTIYTTKLLRRGTDINRAAPWRAVADLKVTDVMRPFQPALPLPPGATAAETADRGGAAGDLAGRRSPGRLPTGKMYGRCSPRNRSARRSAS